MDFDLTGNEDDLLLNFHDVCVYRRDLRILQDPTAWLNDTCINFQLAILQDTMRGHRDHRHDRLLDANVVSFLVHQCEDETDLHDFCQGNNYFHGIDRVFFPVNDSMESNVNWTARSGSHWSLLLAVCTTTPSANHADDGDQRHSKMMSPPIFLHFDSISASNSEAARSVADRWLVVRHLISKSQGNKTKTTGHVFHAKVYECRVPRQSNGYDCGLHVLATVEALLSMATTFASGPPAATVEMYEQQVAKVFVQPIQSEASLCSSLRQKIADQVLSLTTQKKTAE